MSTPHPPKNFSSWLDYAIATMDTRGAYIDRLFEGEDTPTQDEMRAAAQEELDHLKQRAAMLRSGMLDN